MAQITISFFTIAALFLSIVLLVLGILYLARKGRYYEKLLEKRSEESIRTLGVLFVIVGCALLAMSVITMIY